MIEIVRAFCYVRSVITAVTGSHFPPLVRDLLAFLLLVDVAIGLNFARPLARTSDPFKVSSRAEELPDQRLVLELERDGIFG